MFRKSISKSEVYEGIGKDFNDLERFELEILFSAVDTKASGFISFDEYDYKVHYSILFHYSTNIFLQLLPLMYVLIFDTQFCSFFTVGNMYNILNK